MQIVITFDYNYSNEHPGNHCNIGGYTIIFKFHIDNMNYKFTSCAFIAVWIMKTFLWLLPGQDYIIFVRKNT